MKKGWQKQRLTAVTVKITDGSHNPPKGVDESDYLMLSSKNVFDDDLHYTDPRYLTAEQYQQEDKRTGVVPDDVLLTIVGTIGRSAVVPTDAPRITLQRSVAVIRPNRQLIEPRFLMYSFIERCAELNEQARGVAQKGIYLESLRELELMLPPLAEQQRIVGLLDEAFEGIAVAIASTEKNRQNAHALFDSDLDSAITGKLTRDWRRDHPTTENASTDLTRRLAERRSHRTGVGKYQEPDDAVTNKPIGIPHSWVLASPEQVATHIVDCPHSTPKWSKSGVLCLRTTNFKPGFLDLESVQFVSEQTYKERILRLEPKSGDVLYSREGGILGIACIIPEQLKTCLGQRMMLFRLDTNLALPEYFTAVLNSTLILSEVRRLTGGAASPHLNIRDIRTFPIPLPPITEQRQIVAKLDIITTETQRLVSIYERKLTALEALKKSLLHQAFTGEL